MITWASGYFLFVSVILIVFEECSPASLMKMDRPKKVNIGDHTVQRLTNKKPGVEQAYNITNDQMSAFRIWSGGVVLYMIDEISFDQTTQDWLRWYLKSIHTHTHLEFGELRKPPDDELIRWILFINRVGQLECIDYSPNDFTVNGVQRVLLGYDCMNVNDMAATVLAIAGVPPQHNAPYRDKYIKVNAENILPDKSYKFAKLSKNEWLSDISEYDYFSAGHYDTHKYTANGSATITFKSVDKLQNPPQKVFGFSPVDIHKLKIIYDFASPSLKGERFCQDLFEPKDL